MWIYPDDDDSLLQQHTGFVTDVPLKFVRSEERYSVYRDSDGDETYLAHGTAAVLVPFDDLNLVTLWQEHDCQNRDFLDLLRSRTIEPDRVEYEIGFCKNCSEPDLAEDLHSVHDGRVCESCLDEYWFCNDCEERYPETTTTLSETEVCERCRGNNWTYCEDCDGYRRDEDSEEHNHNEGCDCDVPEGSFAFTVRNDGEAPLANDTRATITLPAGLISDEGIGEIAMFLRNHTYNLETDDPDRQHLWSLSLRLSELGAQWQTKRGNFTKRLSRFAHTEFALKLAPEVVSRVGCIARDHSTAVDFEIETTRNLNLSAEEFAHEESCWWQSYYHGRCALKSNGGFGMRTFAERSWGEEVTGRAWVMPLRRTESGELVPTFETQEPDAFVVFNGYGNLSGYTPARILSHMAGMTYRKVAFSCSPMYVNSDSGYLVAPEEIAEPYTDGSLSLTVSQHSNLFHDERAQTHA